MRNTNLPEAYLDRMHNWLGDEFEAFLASYQLPPWTGVRVNSLKISPEHFQNIAPFELSPIDWCPTGFIVRGGKPGKHPYHAAGLYYVQEPSAMAVVELLAPQPGERVIDLAAAPGGKATQIAAKLQGRGILVANEIHPRRVWELAQNLERWGAQNVIITNETLKNLADHWGAYFDRVLLDAPCSGEGLFRRSEESRLEWSLEAVQSCSIRQAGLLPQAARLVRPGGKLVYSTCTFSVEENEEVISNFIKDHPDFELSESKFHWTSTFDHAWRGETQALPPDFEWRGVYRLMPHKISGEGHFIAVMRRRTGGEWVDVPPYRIKPIAKDLMKMCMNTFQQITKFELNPQRISLEGSHIYLIPPGASQLNHLRCIRPGWLIGEVKKERIEPSHAFALGLSHENLYRWISFPADHPALLAYLRGERIQVGQILPAHAQLLETDGWITVCVDDFPLGWGKVSQGVLKNLYPRGLRWV